MTRRENLINFSLKIVYCSIATLSNHDVIMFLRFILKIKVEIMK
jgi:hypothetical protein